MLFSRSINITKILILISLIHLAGCSEESDILTAFENSNGNFDVCELSLLSDGGSMAYCLYIDGKKIWIELDMAIQSDHRCSLKITYKEDEEYYFKSEQLKPSSNMEKRIVSLLKKWLSQNFDTDTQADLKNIHLKNYSEEKIITANAVLRSINIIEKREVTPYCHENNQ